jgi:hypothetical protein
MAWRFGVLFSKSIRCSERFNGCEKWYESGEGWRDGRFDSQAKPPRCRDVRPSQTPIYASASGGEDMPETGAGSSTKLQISTIFVLGVSAASGRLGAGSSRLQAMESVLVWLMGRSKAREGTARQGPSTRYVSRSPSDVAFVTRRRRCGQMRGRPSFHGSWERAELDADGRGSFTAVEWSMPDRLLALRFWAVRVRRGLHGEPFA